MSTKPYYFLMDCKRSILSEKFLIGAVGCFFVLFFGAFSEFECGISAYYMYVYNMFGMPFLLTLTFGSLAYADCFCADLENNFIRQQVVRGSIFKYTISKIAAIIVSSMLTYMVGAFGYLLAMRIKFPWIHQMEKEELCERSVLTNHGHMLSYFALITIQYALLVALMAQLAAYVSLYINNRLMILTIPLMAYYSMMYLGIGFFRSTPSMRIEYIFIPEIFSPFSNDLLCFLWALLVFAVISFIIGILIYKKIQRILGGE